MPQFWIAIHHTNDYDASAVEDEAMERAIDVLNEEMVNAGVRVFVGGLHGPSAARSVWTDASGKATISNGSYLKTTEHVAGFWVLDVANLDAALEWACKAALACRAGVEVRPFH